MSSSAPMAALLFIIGALVLVTVVIDKEDQPPPEPIVCPEGQYCIPPEIHYEVREICLNGVVY